MQLKAPVLNLLGQLQFVVEQINNEAYTSPVKILANATIGQHTRHILEFFIELNKGYENGTVDYDRRERDHRIESDKFFAVEMMQQIGGLVEKPEREINLRAEYGNSSTSAVSVPTNYSRELVYNMEHMVHHMALIRIGVEAMTTINVPVEFGVATSTLKYRQTCAR
jgi:hypothetical protein